MPHDVSLDTFKSLALMECSLSDAALRRLLLQL